MTTATGPQPQLSATPSGASFGNVVTGTSNSQTINLTNGGSASVTISQANLTGTGFGITGLALPATIASGKTATFNIVFAPTTPGGTSGSVSLVSNAPNSPLVISTNGTGVAPIQQLSASPASLSFGNVTVGSSGTQAVTLTSTGNSSVSVSQINVAVTAFSVSGMALPVTLSAGQSASFSVMFAPLTSGGLTDSVSVLSTASNSPATIAISGTGVLAASHSVVLTWNPSTSVVVGYYIYRGTLSGGPYTKLNSTPVLVTTYTDSAVLSGQTYFYVATAVDSNSVESLFSSEISATIPTP